MRLDAHCHTDCSDGNLTIEERIAMVKACKYDAATITDHDFISVEQVERARLACGELPYIPGIELTLSHNRQVVHLLGYFISPSNQELRDHIANVQALDYEITEKLVSFFNRRGVGLSMEDLESSSLHTFYSLQLVKRVAKDLFGYDPKKTMRSFKQAMESAHVVYPDFSSWSVREGIDLIHKSGGIAVLAHPGGEDERVMKELSFLNHTEEIIAEYCDFGLDGLEVYTTVHNSREKIKYADIAHRRNLLITAGSDCHGDDPFLGPALMGTMTDIPPNLYEDLLECSKRKH